MIEYRYSIHLHNRRPFLFVYSNRCSQLGDSKSADWDIIKGRKAGTYEAMIFYPIF